MLFTTSSILSSFRGRAYAEIYNEIRLSTLSCYKERSLMKYIPLLSKSNPKEDRFRTLKHLEISRDKTVICQRWEAGRVPHQAQPKTPQNILLNIHI